MSQYSTGIEFKHIDIRPDLQVNEPIVVSVCKNFWQPLTDMINNSDELQMAAVAGSIPLL